MEGLEHCAPRNDAEQTLAQRLLFEPRIRLACQTQVYGNGKITLRRLALDAEDSDMLDRQHRGRMSSRAIGEEKQIAILFADLRGFTSFSELLPPYDVIYVLNRYYNRMGKIIHQYDGMINNYMGDGLMALFGWRYPDQAAAMAIQAALDMQAAMASLNHYLDSLYKRQLRLGIGIHFGPVVIGTVGATQKDLRITAIGDAVNYASRIESATKRVDAPILISEEAYLQVQPKVAINRYWNLDIPGKSGKYRLYEVVSIEPNPILECKMSAHSASSPIFSFWKWVRAIAHHIRRIFNQKHKSIR